MLKHGGVSLNRVHEHMFVLSGFWVYAYGVDSTLAEITAGVADGFAQLLLYVSEHPLSGDDVVAVRRLVDTAEFVCTQTVSQFAAGTEFHELGHRDVGSWLAATTGARRTEGHARCEQARLLEVLDEVNSAVLAGTFSAAQLRCLSAAVTRRREGLAKRDQTVFVNAAETLDASQFALVVQRWAALVDDQLSDPTQPGRGDGSEFEDRRVQLTRLLNGCWRLTGLLDPLAGETVEAVLAAVTPPPTPDDTRTVGQRRADGFVDLCRDFLGRPDRGSMGSERPNVNVVFHAADGSGHTTGGWFLRNWQICQVLCDATVTAAVVTLKGVPFDVGTPVSAIPARNRKAVVVRDRGCRFGGCARPARWCEIHHIKERQHGGTHELDNLVLMCTYHHREVHRRGITLTWNETVLNALFPNGVMVHGPPHPHTFAAVA